MRADRLISLLMLLQTRARMTARELSEELEVSERTIYRDLEALSISGIPVFAERGPGGGCSLVDSYRSSLTGLTQAEVRALLSLTIPGPLTELGLGQDLKGALLKLSAAHPIRDEFLRQRLHLDWAGWFQGREQVPFLAVIKEAVWKDRKIWLTYRVDQGFQVETVVEPYGLAAKAGIWYLVACRRGYFRAYRISELGAVRVLGDPFDRQTDFCLAEFWETWCASIEGNRPSYPVTARVSPLIFPFLSSYFGAQIQECTNQAAPPDADGWVSLVLPFETFEEARQKILGLGRAVEVIEPLALRYSILDFAEQIFQMYKDRSDLLRLSN